MSGYILCQTKKADKPFFVESINTNIYSLEELCYFLPWMVKTFRPL